MNMNTRQGRLHPLILLGLFAFAPTFASAAVPAFPGAQGAGAASVGGRGGHVIEVTNLNDSGPGSFRDAVSQTGPRTVVFRVGGTITLQSAVFIREPYLTIAGQTAPGGGIQFRGHSISITDGAHDIIVRYIRSRRGSQGPGGTDAKGFEVVSYSRTVYNVIVDHSSFGWQQDDNSIWNKVRNVTYQWNIFAEANNPDAFNGRGGKGLLLGAPPRLGQELGTISLHHNYIASNFMRNPAITGDGPTEVVNNVIYNWGAFGSQIQNRGAGTKVNFIGNYYKKGPDTNSRYEVLVTAGRSDVKEELPQMIYTRDNFGPHRTSSAQAEWAIVGYYGSGSAPAPTSFQRGTPWPSSGYPITVSPAQANVENVLNNVGATLPARDAVDARLVAEYRAGTGSIGGDNRWPVLAAGTPPADTDHDGMPDRWETAKGLNRNSAADRNADAGSGYTNLEVYLAGAASGTTPPPPPPPPPPTTPLPDVVVTSLSYASGIFTSTVKNQGTVATPTGPTVGVAYYVDGVARASGFVNGPLAAGASVTIGTTSAPYTIPNGTHTIMAFVDDVNRFAESDETNNQLAK
jgi:pectate lyase